MQNRDALSKFRVVRLNGQLFPVSRYETERYQNYQLQPAVVERAGTTAILRQAEDCDALLVVSETLSQETIAGLKRCRVIARLGAGTDKIDVDVLDRFSQSTQQFLDMAMEIVAADLTNAEAEQRMRQVGRLAVEYEAMVWRSYYVEGLKRT